MGLLVLLLGGCAANPDVVPGDAGGDADATIDTGSALPDATVIGGDTGAGDAGDPFDATSAFDGSFGGDGMVLSMRDGGPTEEELGEIADDPPARECRMDGTMGTPVSPPMCSDMGLYRDPDPAECNCPVDKVVEGCPCIDPSSGAVVDVGQTRPCWTGRRAQRGQGICRDGVATCEQFDEFSGRWGECSGETLPQPGAVAGANACGCFSAGRWRLLNTSPCFYGYDAMCRLTDSCITGAVSTTLSGGVGQCPSVSSCSDALRPAGAFSENYLTVDCVGQFNLTFTIKANATAGAAPPPVNGPDAVQTPTTDCVVGSSTTTGWYAMEGVEQRMPDLPGWLGTDWACAQRFQTNGGYFEMTVTGTSELCEEIGLPGGQPRVFNRGRYCSCECNAFPTRADCVGCRTGGSGSF